MNAHEFIEERMSREWDVFKANSKGKEDVLEELERVFPDVIIRVSYLISLSETPSTCMAGFVAALDYIDERIIALQKTIDTYETALKEVNR